MASYLIIGAGGYVGARLARRLLRRGHAVRGLVRHPDTEHVEALAASGMVVWHGDVTEPESLIGVTDGIDYVYNLTSASILHAATLRRTLVDGNRYLLAACSRSRQVRAYIYTSNVAVYGDAGDAVVTEDTRPRPCCEAGDSMLEAEHVLREHTHRHGLPAIILRLATIYGPQRDVTDPILNRTLTIFGDGSNYVPRIHIDDLLPVLEQVATYGQAGTIYNVGDDQPLRLRDFYAAMQSLLDIDQPPRWYPRAEALAAGLNPTMVALATASVRLSNARIKDELHIALTYPDVLAWLAERAPQLAPALHRVACQNPEPMLGYARAAQKSSRCYVPEHAVLL